MNTKLIKEAFVMTVIITIMVFISSCKHTNQQNEMLDALENSGVEVSDELRNEIGYNWADIVFPLIIVLSLGLISFFIVRKAKSKINDIGYSFGDIKSKMEVLKDGKKAYKNMSEEEKKGFDAMQKLFDKKTKMNNNNL